MNEFMNLQSASPGIRRIVNQIKPKTYHRSLAYAFYGKRFDQIHGQSTENHVAAREQAINIGEAGGKYYTATNYASWLVTSF